MHYGNDTLREATAINIGFGRGFVPCPAAVWSGVTAEQAAAWQAIYERAYAEARAKAGYRTVTAQFGRDARN